MEPTIGNVRPLNAEGRRQREKSGESVDAIAVRSHSAAFAGGTAGSVRRRRRVPACGWMPCLETKTVASRTDVRILSSFASAQGVRQRRSSFGYFGEQHVIEM